jgi:hypothetical protein
MRTSRRRRPDRDPGLVATNTTLSVAEINQLEQTNDYSSGSPGSQRGLRHPVRDQSGSTS